MVNLKEQNLNKEVHMTVPYKPIDGQIMTDERDGDYVKASDFNISNIEIEKTLINHYDVLRESQATDTTTDNRLDILEAEMDDVEAILSGLGLGINWVGSVPTHADLLALTGMVDNDAYTVVHDETLNGNTAVWVWLEIEGAPGEWKLLFEVSFAPDATATNDGLMTKEKFNQVDSNSARLTIAETDINNLEVIKADITYVDAQDDVLQTNIELKADTTYVDSQDAGLQANINLKADTAYVNQQDNNLANAVSALNTKVSGIAFGASLLQETITAGGTGVVWPTTAALLDMTVAVKPSNYQPLLLERKFTETAVAGDKPYLLFKSVGRYKVLVSFKAHHTNANPVTLTVRAFVNGVVAATFTNNMAGATNETFAFSEVWDYEKISSSAVDEIHFDYVASVANVTSDGYRFEAVLETDQGTGAITVPTNDVVSVDSTNYIDGQTQTFINDDLKNNHTSLDASVVKLTGDQTVNGVKIFPQGLKSQTLPAYNDDVTNKEYVDNNYVSLSGDTMNGGLSFGNELVTNPVDTSRHVKTADNYGVSVSNGSQNYVVNSGGIHTFMNAGGQVFAYIKNAVDNAKSLVTKEYVDNKVNGGIQIIEAPVYTDGYDLLQFDEPIDILDIIKIEVSGSYSAEDVNGVKGLGIRPNEVSTGFGGYGYDIYGDPTGLLSTWYNESNVGLLPLAYSNQNGSDHTFHTVIVPSTREWTVRGNSWRYQTQGTWDVPTPTIDRIALNRLGENTAAWYDVVFTINTKSGKQYSYEWNPLGYKQLDSSHMIPIDVGDISGKGIIPQPDIDNEVETPIS